MKKVKILFKITFLTIVLSTVVFNPKLVNAQQNWLITVGNTTVNNNTSISDITKTLGQPKITTPSAFGGEAYTFYTDNNYSNFLYIETTKTGEIASYGSVDKTYSVTGDQSNNDPYDYSSFDAYSGYRLANSGTIIGGVYYNEDVVRKDYLFNTYESNYKENPKTYLKGLIKHGIAMYNALSLRLNKKANITFDENLFNISEDYKSKNTSFREILLSTENKTYSLSLGVKENVNIKETEYVFNPLIFASLAKNNTSQDYSTKNIAIFDYDLNTKLLYEVVVSKDLQEKLSDLSDLQINEEDVITLQNIHYVMDLLDSQMTEHEKAHIIAQYLQEGTAYGYGKYPYSYKGLFNDHIIVCEGFSEAMAKLANVAGLKCEQINSKTMDHTWNICKLDNEWTYIDTTKSIAAKYQTIDHYREFFAKNSTEHYFLDATISNGMFNKESGQSFPLGTSSSLFNHDSRVFYDDTYMYYEQTPVATLTTYLYRENRKTKAKEVLTQVAYAGDNTNLVKDKNTLYYVGTDDSIYSMDINTKQTKKLVSPPANKKIGGVLIRDGYINYTTYDPNNQNTTQSLVQYKPFSEWPTLKTYTFNDNIHNYKLKYLESSNSITIYKAVSNGSELPSGPIYIPDTINNKPVIGIGDEAFYSITDSNNLTGKVTLPKYLEFIGSRAFSNNKKITEVIFPNTLKYIGDGAFSNTGLTGELIIPNSVKTLGNSAFMNNSKITKITLSNNLSYLPGKVFEGLTSLSDVVEIPEGIEYIAINAFTNCQNLKAIILPSTLKEISSSALSNCPNLEEIIIKSSKIEYMTSNDKAKIYLPKNTTTSKYADSNNISYKELKQEITLSKTELKLAINAKENITYTITPKYYYPNTTLTWSSNNNRVASVDNNGTITAKANGVATITVTTSNNQTASCKVTVGTGISDYLKGDINKDTKVDVLDAREALSFAVGRYKVTDQIILSGDMDLDNKITATDAAQILKIYLKK